MEHYQKLSFADAEYANKGKVTRREKFLNQLEEILPWSVMRAVIKPHYALGKGCGRKPFALNAMLHAHVAQIVYNYSDPGMEDALYNIESLRRFCGIRLEAMPDESTLLQFRHLLEAHGLLSRFSKPSTKRWLIAGYQGLNQRPGCRPKIHATASSRCVRTN